MCRILCMWSISDTLMAITGKHLQGFACDSVTQTEVLIERDSPITPS